MVEYNREVAKLFEPIWKSRYMDGQS